MKMPLCWVHSVYTNSETAVRSVGLILMLQPAEFAAARSDFSTAPSAMH